MKKNMSLVIIMGIFSLIQALSAQTWEAAKRLTSNPGSSFTPVIAADSNKHLHTIWYDYTPGQGELYYAKSTDRGTTWSTKRLTWGTGISSSPAIAIDSDNHIHVVWNGNTPGNSEIFYKRSTDGGTIWATKRLTWNAGNSDHPTIAVDSDKHIHVVWMEMECLNLLLMLSCKSKSHGPGNTI